MIVHLSIFTKKFNCRPVSYGLFIIWILPIAGLCHVTFRYSRPRSSDFAYSSPRPRDLLSLFVTAASVTWHSSVRLDRQTCSPFDAWCLLRPHSPLDVHGWPRWRPLIWLWEGAGGLVGEVPVHAPALETVWEILLHGVAGEAGRPPAPLLLTHLQDLRQNSFQHF